MKWIAAVLLGSLTLSAHAAAPDAPTPAPKKTDRAAAPEASALTLEKLDRYIQYRREADAIMLRTTDAAVQQSRGRDGTSTLTINVNQLKQQDDAMRAKYGLAGEDFRPLDQMVRNISEARFKSESASAKAAIQSLEAKAAGPEGPDRDMARSLIAFWKKDLKVDPLLTKERAEYGSATVDLVLQREKELKEIWLLKDAAAARALGATLNATP